MNWGYSQSESLMLAEIFDLLAISTQCYLFYGWKDGCSCHTEVYLFRKGTTWIFFIQILPRKGPDGIWMREQSKQEIGCQRNKGPSREKFREVTQCFHPKATHWGSITTESFGICLSPDSTKHTVSKGNLCSNSLLTGKSVWLHSTLSSSFTKKNYRKNS